MKLLKRKTLVQILNPEPQDSAVMLRPAKGKAQGKSQKKNNRRDWESVHLLPLLTGSPRKNRQCPVTIQKRCNVAKSPEYSTEMFSHSRDLRKLGELKSPAKA